MKRKILVLLFLCILSLSGCSPQSTYVSRNLSQDADNFLIQRRLTVFNTRTNKVLYQMIGNFSILTDVHDKQLEVTCKIDNSKYSKHFVYLNQDTTYIIEDLSGANVENFTYELNFLPEEIPGIKIVRKK